MSGWTPVLVAVGSAIVVAVAGGVLTTTGPWYRELRLPSWKPPDWAFGPVWTTIFVLAVISALMAWNGAPNAETRAILLGAYAVNAILNIAWSGIFFRMRRPDWALVEVAFLWLSIVALILVTAPISGVAALLLLPYLAWVSVASYLNLTIVRMNAPFGAG